MCLLHNSIIRGFNSIYLQAPHVKDADKADFVGYSLTWFRFVKSHHDDEEENLFTKVEELLGDKDIWTETHKEHGASTQPLLTTCHQLLTPASQSLSWVASQSSTSI
jgi:hemerythrin-like domain-containing protein